MFPVLYPIARTKREFRFFFRFFLRFWVGEVWYPGISAFSFLWAEKAWRDAVSQKERGKELTAFYSLHLVYFCV